MDKQRRCDCTADIEFKRGCLPGSGSLLTLLGKILLWGFTIFLYLVLFFSDRLPSG